MSQIKQGYKQTKVGVIPEDWDVVKLGSVLNEKPKYGIGASAVEYSCDLPTYLRITDIDENGNFKPESKASVDDSEYKNYILRENELVFARTGATVGKSYLYDKNDGELVYAGFLIKISPNNQKLNSVFLNNFARSHTYWSWITVMSARSGQPGVNAEEYALMPIPLPSIKEQEKIAEILTTWDEAISKQEELIKAKEEQKKGLMQKLLSGEVRFSGFSDEWKKMNGDKLFESISNKNHNSDLPILAISQEYGAVPRELINYHISVSDKSIDSYKIVDVGDFIISLRSFQGGIEYSNYKGICSPAYIVLRSCAPINNLFYKFYFKTDYFIKKLCENLEGIRDGKMISFKYFSEIQLPYPSIPEQQKIAEVLSLAGEEISLLKKELDELKLQKKGLMQKLLTGKVRVKI